MVDRYAAETESLPKMWSEAPRPVYERKLELETTRTEVIVRLALRSLNYSTDDEDWKLSMQLDLDNVSSSRIEVTIYRKPSAIWRHMFAGVMRGELQARIHYWLFEGESHFMMAPIIVVFA